jgi:cholesterol transport system auxiliary component
MKIKFKLSVGLTLILIAAISLGGCVSLKKKYPEKNYFVLDISRDTAVTAPVEAPILKIRKFRISPRYQSRNLVYRLDELRYDSDFYNVFFTNPDVLLTEEVRDWLGATGLFSHVTDLSNYVEPEYILEGAVTALYGDFTDAANPKAVLEIKMLLINSLSSETDIIFKNDYRSETPIKDNHPDSVIVGMNQALTDIMTALESDLGKLKLK